MCPIWSVVDRLGLGHRRYGTPKEGDEVDYAPAVVGVVALNKAAAGDDGRGEHFSFMDKPFPVVLVLG
jgi:hypothetical protein